MTCQSSSDPRPAPFASFFASEALELATLTRRLVVLTGVSHTTAERRAQTLIKWRRYVQKPGAEKGGGLDLSDPAPQIEALVARHNALVKQQTRRSAAASWTSCSARFAASATPRRCW